jgi:hypothetical protein
MIFVRAAIVSAFTLGATCAHLKIPHVEHIVSNVLQEYGDVVRYSGNQTDGTYISKRETTPYWYETIAHQGISAFGPAGYQVYRNVKDYGAKGIFHLSGMINPTSVLTADQVMVSQMILRLSMRLSTLAAAVAKDVHHLQPLLQWSISHLALI